MADELYGLSLEDFVATRTARVKQARTEGDRPLADLIGSLRKPTVAGWLTNQLVRSHRDEMDLLLDLGRELRDVMADVGGAELRDLTKQRYQLVSALVQAARALARKRGRPASDDVAQSVRATLEATLADDESAELVTAGRLVDALAVSGFGLGSPGADRERDGARSSSARSSAARSSAAPPAEPPADLDAQRRRHERKLAQRDVEAAQSAAKRAAEAARRAGEKLQQAQLERDEMVATVERLREELEQAESAAVTLEQSAERAQAAADDAVAEARGSDEEVAAAEARLAELEGAAGG